jgi:hypothetical protein
MSIILDVRAGEKNASSSGLGLRVVREEDREAYDLGLKGEYLLIAEGDSEVALEGVEEEVSLTFWKEEGGYFYYKTGISKRLEGARTLDGLESLRVVYGGSVLEGVSGGLTSCLVTYGAGYWWTRNDSFRERFSHEGGTWELLKGGVGEYLGEVGLDEFDVSEGELRLSGGSIYAVSDVLVDGKVVLEGHDGEGVFHISGKLGTSGVHVRSGDILSPQPMVNEYPLLRGDSGHVSVRYVEEFSGSERLGEAEVLRSSGEVRFSGGGVLSYEGLVLCGAPEGFEREDLGNVFNGGLSSSVEGEKHWVLVGGKALVLRYVEELPKRLSSRYAYGYEGRVYLSSSWKREVEQRGHRLVKSVVGLRGLGHYSQLPALGLSGSFHLEGGGLVEIVDGEVSSGEAEIDRFGFVILGEGVASPSGVEEANFLRSLGLVPGDLETGLRYVQSQSSVSGNVYYSSEAVGKVSGNLTFQRLTLKPRSDLSGVFLIGDRELVEGSDYESAEGGFHWIEEKELSGKITEEVSSLFLGAGLRPGSTSLILKREDLSGEYVEEELVEGVDYDLPSEGLEGRVRFKQVLGGEKLRGVSSTLVSEGVLDFGVELGVGDWVYDGYGYFRVAGVSGTEARFVSGAPREGVVWTSYEGYLEEDVTKLLGERFVELEERAPVEVFKIYPEVSFEKVAPTSTLYLSGDYRVPFVVLRDENLESPYVLDLNDDHVSAGSYRLRVDGVDYEEGVIQNQKGFTLSAQGDVIFELNGLPDESWVDGGALLVRVPREGLTDRAEYSLDGVLTHPFGGGTFEFLEMLSEVRFNATAGSVSFEQPLEAGISVEVSYTPTDSDGVRVIEEMAFTKIQESAERLSERDYSYNPTGLNVELALTPTVYVGAEQVSGSEITQQGIRLPFSVSEGTNVKISYVTTQSLGGEQVVKTSTSMVLPKYEISKGASSIEIPEGFSLGVSDIIKMEGHLFMITSINGTSVGVYPPARFNISTTKIWKLQVSPLTLLDEGGVAQSIYPAFRGVGGAQISSKPGSPDVFLQGDYRDYIFGKSVIILEGTPYLVSSVSVDDATGVTKLTIDGFTQGHEFTSTTSTFYVSYRPILSVGDKTLRLTTGALLEEEYGLFKEVSGVGVGLKVGKDYKVNGEGGEIILMKGIGGDESYYFRHTALGSIKPSYMLGGRISYPRYKAVFKQSVAPTAFDGLELLCRGYVYSPDKFQMRIVDDEVYGSEVASRLIQEANSGKGQGNKQTLSSGVSGRSIGFYDVLGDDVVARSRILLYQGYIQPIEDLISTATGAVVGDTDGGFKFNLLQGRGAGMEDPITREIYPRYVSMELLAPLNPANLSPSPEDMVTIGGSAPELDVLYEVLEGQRALIENEMDDYVLLTQRRTTSYSTSFPFVDYEYHPVYGQMWEQHRYSRLFPENTQMMTITAPGSLYGDKSGKTTNGFVLGHVENPALGQITNITSLTLKKRGARFHIVDFSSEGFPEINALSDGKPTFLVSAVSFNEFPTDPITGLPDTTQFVSQGGTIPCAESGNVELRYRGLQAGDRLMKSREGVFYPLLDTSKVARLPSPYDLFSDQSEPRHVVVESVLSGCLVVLSGDASTITCGDTSLAFLSAYRGETLAQSFQKDLDDEDTPSSIYRVGSDVGLRTSTGEIIDISLPSISNGNWPFKEIQGQNVPSGLTPLEGEVGFTYGSTAPFKYPALEGLPYNDSGDITIPYQKRFSERDLLFHIPPVLLPLEETALNEASGEVEYLYPDELRDNQTSINHIAIDFTKDMGKLTGVCEQKPRQGDLLMVVPDYSGEAGSAATGVMEVAYYDEANNRIYPPQFDAPNEGTSYQIQNMSVELADNRTQGVHIYESLLFDPATSEWNSIETTFSFTHFNPQEVIQKIEASSSSATLTLRLHHPTTYLETFVVYLDYDGAVWSVSSHAGEGFLVVGATNTTLASYDANSFTLLQKPIPNTLTIAEEVQWPSNVYSTWTYGYTSTDYLWGNLSTYREASTDGTTKVFKTTILGEPLYLDYRIDLEINDSSDVINEDRISFHIDGANLSSWFYRNVNSEILLLAGGGAQALDVTPLLSIFSSQMEVKEIGGAGVHLLTSDINAHEGYRYGEDFHILDSETLRFNPMSGVERANDPTSLFIGSEVTSSGNILSGSGAYNAGGVAGFLEVSDAEYGSLESIHKCDVVYIKNGHGAGTYRVRSVNATSSVESVSEVLGTSSIFPITFPKLTALIDHGDGKATIETNVEDLSLHFPETGALYVLLNESYLSQPLSSSPNTYDQTFARSIVRVVYDSISGNAFNFTEDTSPQTDNPTFLDGGGGNLPTGVSLEDLVGLIGEGGQKIGGATKIPLDIVASGIFDCPTPFKANSVVITLALSNGLTIDALGALVLGDLGVYTSIELDPATFPDVVDTTAGNVYGTSFLSEGDVISMEVDLPAGISLDPATPRMWRDYSGNTPVVWGDGSANLRAPSDYTLSNEPA